MILMDLFASDSFVSNIAKVAVDTGFAKSEVLSTLSKPKFARAAVEEIAPVPPALIGNTPANLLAVSVNKE